MIKQSLCKFLLHIKKVPRIQCPSCGNMFMPYHEHVISSAATNASSGQNKILLHRPHPEKIYQMNTTPTPRTDAAWKRLNERIHGKVEGEYGAFTNQDWQDISQIHEALSELQQRLIDRTAAYEKKGAEQLARIQWLELKLKNQMIES